MTALRLLVGARLRVLVLLVLLAMPAAGFAGERRYTIDDALGVESLGPHFGGPYAFAPDGKGLAFTRVRTYDTVANFKWSFFGNERGDVWIQTDSDAAPVNVTNGAQDGSGWWAPQWSPDGKRLAMLSTRGGNVHIWLWEAQSGQVRRLSARAVDAVFSRPFLWIDEHRLLYPALPEGDYPLGMRYDLDTPRIATREWQKAQQGKEVTASVLDSGVTPDLEKRPHGQLRLIDIAGGDESVVADASAASWSLSPDRRTVAFTWKNSVYAPRADEPLPDGMPTVSNRYSIGLALIGGGPLDVAGEISRDLLPESLRWSPDGTELAFLGYGDARSKPPRLYRLNLARRSVEVQPLGELDADPVALPLLGQQPLEWAAGDAGSGPSLLVLAAERRDGARTDPAARRDWWLIGQDGNRHRLSADMKTAPQALWPVSGQNAFVGLAAGELWRIEPATGKVESLTRDFKPEIEQIIWPAHTLTSQMVEEWPYPGRRYTHLVFTAGGEAGAPAYRIALAGGRIDALKPPAANAQLKAYAPESETALFHRSDRDGFYLWQKQLNTGKTRQLIASNTFLREIKTGRFQAIDYTSLDGKPLKAWLLLPPDYRKGKRYPLLTWVYAGFMAGPKPPTFFGDLSEGGALNLHIPSARGYAILLPSMPRAPQGGVDDPMPKLPNGVLPAVDKVVEMGVADPRRLFLMGHSMGGFSTYGLVTQTDRFTAAVSSAGISNWISLYGRFDARTRYSDQAHENLIFPAMIEARQPGTGNPPWKDLWRFVRNSPIFYVDRVNTPVMIVQGDFDMLQQGEEFFTGLYRQGKRARFVRYWGEGHGPSSPANIRDMWERIFAWFDEFSPQPSP